MKRATILIMFLLYNQIISNPIQTINKTYPTKINPFILNEIEIAKQIKQLDIKEPEICYKQILLETGHFKSKLAVKHFNLFGMKRASYPQNHDTILRNRDLSYHKSGWINSIKDYKEYQLRNGTSLKRYSKTENYKLRLKRINIKQEIKNILED